MKIAFFLCSELTLLSGTYLKNRGRLQTQATLLQVSLPGRFHIGHSLVLEKLFCISSPSSIENIKLYRIDHTADKTRRLPLTSKLIKYTVSITRRTKDIVSLRHRN